MAVKYTCPKCNRRFADWGAKKLNFKCPHDESCPPGTEGEMTALLRVGASTDDVAAAKPTLKRKKAAASGIVQESNLLTSGEDFDVVEEIDADEIDDVEDTEEEEPEVLKGGGGVITEVVIDEEEVVAEEDTELGFEGVEPDVVVEEFVELDEEV